MNEAENIITAVLKQDIEVIQRSDGSWSWRIFNTKNNKTISRGQNYTSHHEARDAAQIHFFHQPPPRFHIVTVLCFAFVAVCFLVFIMASWYPREFSIPLIFSVLGIAWSGLFVATMGLFYKSKKLLQAANKLQQAYMVRSEETNSESNEVP